MFTSLTTSALMVLWSSSTKRTSVTARAGRGARARTTRWTKNSSTRTAILRIGGRPAASRHPRPDRRSRFSTPGRRQTAWSCPTPRSRTRPTSHASRSRKSARSSRSSPPQRSLRDRREAVLYFVAFSAERLRDGRMLAHTFGIAADGVRDRLTDPSRPVTAPTTLPRRSTRWTSSRDPEQHRPKQAGAVS